MITNKTTADKIRYHLDQIRQHSNAVSLLLNDDPAPYVQLQAAKKNPYVDGKKQITFILCLMRDLSGAGPITLSQLRNVLRLNYAEKNYHTSHQRTQVHNCLRRLWLNDLLTRTETEAGFAYHHPTPSALPIPTIAPMPE